VKTSNGSKDISERARSENELRTDCHAFVDRSDLLSAAGNDGLAFGTHRWMLIGPKNSGSNIHIDPLATSAWNMLLINRKLWILFPPDIDESELKSATSLSSESKEDEPYTQQSVR
jgi:hypothetical protein